MLTSMTFREGLRRYKIAGFISFADRKRDPDCSKLRVMEKPGVLR